MTNKELIERLQELPPDALATMDNIDDDYCTSEYTVGRVEYRDNGEHQRVVMMSGYIPFNEYREA